jgi:small neutral amino acid transporter SnatA (MarC family)
MSAFQALISKLEVRPMNPIKAIVELVRQVSPNERRSVVLCAIVCVCLLTLVFAFGAREAAATLASIMEGSASNG